MASSIPWIGNGENTSQRLNPASRICSAAWNRSAAVGSTSPPSQPAPARPECAPAASAATAAPSGRARAPAPSTTIGRLATANALPKSV